MSIKNAQVAAVKFIPQNATVLIVGGGTGWLLEEIAKIQPSRLNIMYVEKSAKMLNHAKQKKCYNNSVVFIEANIEDIEFANDSFDVILLPFVLDCITSKKIPALLERLEKYLIPNGLWLVIDFENPQHIWWKNIVTKMMYRFFQIISNIEATNLFHFNELFGKYPKVAEQRFLSGFIKMWVSRKSIS